MSEEFSIEAIENIRLEEVDRMGGFESLRMEVDLSGPASLHNTSGEAGYILEVKRDGYTEWLRRFGYSFSFWDERPINVGPGDEWIGRDTVTIKTAVSRLGWEPGDGLVLYVYPPDSDERIELDITEEVAEALQTDPDERSMHEWVTYLDGRLTIIEDHLDIY